MSNVNERVFISLKALIDLAAPAMSLNLKHLSPRAQQSGGFLSPVKGRGMEFAESRMYQAGDDVRNIDWRVTARTGKVHTKVFREERERPVFISVDGRHTMRFATRGVFKSVLAAKLAALIAWAAQHQGDRIGGQLFTDSECREVKPENGKHAVLRFLNVLLTANESKHTQQTIQLDSVLARLVQHAHPGSLVYIISDFRGFNATSELHLSKLAKHCEIILLFVYDRLEVALPDQGQYRFTDGENDLVIHVNDTQGLAYQQQFQQRLAQLQQLAKRLKLTLIQCSTEYEPMQCLR